MTKKKKKLWKIAEKVHGIYLKPFLYTSLYNNVSYLILPHFKSVSSLNRFLSFYRHSLRKNNKKKIIFFRKIKYKYSCLVRLKRKVGKLIQHKYEKE